MILLAILLPPVYFLFRLKLFQCLLCIFLQLTVIGWIPAAIWAVLDNNRYYADKRHKETLAALSKAS